MGQETTGRARVPEGSRRSRQQGCEIFQEPCSRRHTGWSGGRDRAVTANAATVGVVFGGKGQDSWKETKRGRGRENRWKSVKRPFVRDLPLPRFFLHPSRACPTILPSRIHFSWTARISFKRSARDPGISARSDTDILASPREMVSLVARACSSFFISSKYKQQEVTLMSYGEPY